RAELGGALLAFDELHPARPPEVEQGKSERSHAGSQVDCQARSARAVTGEGGQKERVHVGSISEAARRLAELDTTAEKRVAVDEPPAPPDREVVLLVRFVPHVAVDPAAPGVPSVLLSVPLSGPRAGSALLGTSVAFLRMAGQ